MSIQGFRVRVASEVRFLEKTESQPATAFVRLVKESWTKAEDGTFSKGEPTWFDGKFTGKQAKLVKEITPQGRH